MTGVLVAGVGNIFKGDDAFGVEVAQRLARAPLPAGVTVVDFGIRGIDLTYALLDGYDAAILVDAAAGGHAPGTVSVVEPEIEADSGEFAPGGMMLSAHDLDPAKVLKVVGALGGPPVKVVLVACEPEDLGGDDGAMGLTPVVEAAIEPAMATVRSLVAQLSLGPSRVEQPE